MTQIVMMNTDKKNILKSYFILIICVICVPFSFAQQSNIDSLKNALKSADDDTSKVTLLNRLCSKTISVNLEEAARYAEQMLLLAKQLHYNSGESDAYYQKGYINFYEGKYDSAIYFYEQSKILKEKTNDRKGIARALNSIGAVYHDRGDFTESVNYYLQSLKINEEEKNQSGIATALLNIGVVYSDQKNFEKALEYKQKAYETFLTTGDTAQIANALTRLGNVYWSMQQTRKALDYYYKGLEMFEKINHKRGIAIVYNNIAGIYDERGEHKKSLEIYLKALALRESIGDKNGVVILLNNIGNVYVNLKNPSEAISSFEKSIKIADAIGFKDMLRENYKNLSHLYASKNDYKKAYDFHTKFFMMHDSIFNESTTQSINDLQTKYEIEKRENKITILSKDNEIREAELSKSRLFRNVLGAGIIIVVIVLYLLFTRYRLKQRTNLELEEKNKTIENAYGIIEEKNKNITDSINYAKRIQQAIFPKEEEIKQHFPDSFVLYKPKDIVSGDFYWLCVSQESGVRSSGTKNSELSTVSEPRTTNSELVWLAVCDCTGHGVPGALMSMNCNSLLNESVNEKKAATPAMVFEDVRNGLIKSLKQTAGEGITKDGMDAVLCLWNKKNNSLFAASSNNPLWIIRAEKKNVLEQIIPDKFPVGVHIGEQKPFTNHEIQLQKSDSVYMFTDGYADQFGGPKGKKFKYSQFEKLLLSIHEKPMTEQREILNSTIDGWKGELEQIDDICVIGVRV